MRIPVGLRILVLIVGATGFYTIVGQLVPQKEVQPPKETELKKEMTADELVKAGKDIMEGKGLCTTCHTFGKSGALRFPDLDGVFTYTDIMAIGAIHGLQDAGVVVPRDVAVVGVDDIAVSSIVRPALTTVRIDREAMGARAVEMLLRMRADGRAGPQRETIEVSLVVRESA